MSQKNDVVPLLGAFLITAGLIGGGVWWFTRQSGSDLSRVIPSGSPTASPPIAPTAPPNNGGTAPAGQAPAGQDFASVQTVPSGLFSYGGSTSWAPIRLSVDAEIQRKRPEFRLRYVDPVGAAPGSGTGIRSLIQGELAIAQSSRPLTDQEIQQAQQRGITLNQIPVAIDGLAVAVNPTLNIPGLTIDQLAAIYTGRVTNWNQVGGPSLAIVPLTRPVSAGGTIELFVEQVLKGGQFGSNVRQVNTTTEALRQLIASPGGVYFASAPEVVPQCKVKPIPLGREPNQLVPPYQEPLVASDRCPPDRNRLNQAAFQSGQYPLTRNLYVVVKQNGQAEQQAGEAYANLLRSDEGQKLIEQAGFVRIR